MKYPSVCAFILVTLHLFAGVEGKKKDDKFKELRCSICEALASEIHGAVAKVDPNRKVESGSFRIDSKGDKKAAAKKYAGSELHMVDVLDTICKRFDDYAQAIHKASGRLSVLQLVVDGSMNPNFGDYELKQDPDLNKSLEYYCDGMVEEYEEDITALYGKNPDIKKKDLQKAMCVEMANFCSDAKDEL